MERSAGGENCGKRRNYSLPGTLGSGALRAKFYLEFNTSPAIRMLVKAMANKFGEEKGNSRYLYRLFPKGPAKQATKIAGLPKPVKCI